MFLVVSKIELKAIALDLVELPLRKFVVCTATSASKDLLVRIETVCMRDVW